MRPSCLRASLAFAATLLATRSSYASDPSAALDELKQGYALKQQGNCREAVSHFARSLQLDAKPKAALNLADCEQQLGDLVAAQGHATEGRQLAQQQNDLELASVADEQLATIDKRLPRLIVRLAPGAPTGSTVSRDGVLVESTSLGVQAVVNPGKHTIVASAQGRAGRQFDVTVAEGTHEEINVEPGPPLVAERSIPQPVQPQQDQSQTSKFLTYGALGIGAVGLMIGVATGVAASSKHLALEGECQPNGDCPLFAQADLDGFRSLRTWSTVGYVVGAAGLVAGAVFWFTGPTPTNGAAARVWIGPMSAAVAGAF